MPTAAQIGLTADGDVLVVIGKSKDLAVRANNLPQSSQGDNLTRQVGC